MLYDRGNRSDTYIQERFLSKIWLFFSEKIISRERSSTRHYSSVSEGGARESPTRRVPGPGTSEEWSGPPHQQGQRGVVYPPVSLGVGGEGPEDAYQ